MLRAVDCSDSLTLMAVVCFRSFLAGLDGDRDSSFIENAMTLFKDNQVTTLAQCGECRADDLVLGSDTTGVGTRLCVCTRQSSSVLGGMKSFLRKACKIAAKELREKEDGGIEEEDHASAVVECSS